MKKILMYFRKNTADNLTFNVELANGDLEVVDKLVEVQKEVRRNPPAERPRVGALKTLVTRRQRGRGSARGRRRSPAGKCRGSAYEDAGCGRAEDARQQVAQGAVGAERARLRGHSVRQERSAARRERSAARRIASARGREPAGPGRTFLEPKPHVRRVPSGLPGREL